MKRNYAKLLSGLLAVLVLLSCIPLSALAAPAADIPAEMLDNVYLDALAYTGYHVQTQKDDGTIFKSMREALPPLSAQRSATGPRPAVWKQ